MAHKKIKICLVQTQLYSFFNTSIKKAFGGSEAQFYLMSQELATHNNFNVCCIVGNYKQKKIEQYGPITIYRGVLPSPKQLIACIQAVYLLYLLLKIKPDVIQEKRCQ